MFDFKNQPNMSAIKSPSSNSSSDSHQDFKSMIVTKQDLNSSAYAGASNAKARASVAIERIRR